ncbi:MAG TPA: hypothetical protein VER96_36585 [Polyangiaceae bacterium]|nr:hypothetical protein [Polyangiaceae bacterium]HYQ42792.1 hypothetical protein [Polyangiaceae bacterium]
MKETTSVARFSYPLHALLLVGISWCFFAVVTLALALFMLPIVPLAPVFVMITVAFGGLLSSVHEYARSVATPVRATRLRSRIDGQVSQVPRRAEEAC